MTYSPNPQHRNRTPEKSQWSISLAQEIAYFNTTYANQWIDNNNGWGLHYSEGRLDYLGLAQDYITRVFIAKFVGDRGTWHGYPADHQQNQQDIPTERIRTIWINTNVLRPAQIRKITKGQPCRL